jgi:hypothetical protein
VLDIEDLTEHNYAIDIEVDPNPLIPWCLHFIDFSEEHEGMISLDEKRARMLLSNAKAIIAACNKVIGQPGEQHDANTKPQARRENHHRRRHHHPRPSPKQENQPVE